MITAGRRIVIAHACALGLAASSARAQEGGEPPSAASPDPARSAYGSLFEGVTPVAPDSPTLLRALNTQSGLTSGFAPTTPRLGFHYFADETIRYDDNARRLADKAPTPAGRSRGDFFSVTNVGASAGTKLGLQFFHISGNYGLTRFANNSDLNRSRYGVTAGVDWRIGYPCSGSLVLSADQGETESQNQVVGAIASVTTTERVDLRARCHIYDRFYALAGLGARQSRVSSAPANDARQASARVGLEYAVPKLHTLGFETVFLTNDFFNRAVTPLSSLATRLNQTDYYAYYTYIVSPKTTLRLAAGVTQFDTVAGARRSTQTVPTYSIGAQWRATPKLTFNVGVQTAVGAPQDVVADYSRSQSLTLNAIYAYSPKLSFAANYARQRSTSSTVSAISGFRVSKVADSDSFALDANYRWTPFLTASLGYRFSQRTDNVAGTKSTSNLYTVTLSYRR